MTPIQQTISRIRAYVAAQNISNRKLADQAGVAETTVRNIHRADWNPTVETVERLAGIVPKEFDERPQRREPKQAAQ